MSWLDRYATPVLIRTRGSFQLWRTRTLTDDAPRVVVVPDEAAAAAPAAAALDRLAEGHARLAGGIVPAVAERGAVSGRPFVALACAAVTDLEPVLDRIAARRSRCPYAEGIAMVEALMDVLVRATEVGVCFGALAPANFLVGEDGALALIGAGFNVATQRDDGTPSGAPGIAIAPEVAAGGPATPSGDLYAVTLLVRSLIGFVDFPEAASRVLQGRPDPEDAELAQIMIWSNLAIVAAFAERRPSAVEARDAIEQVWRLLGAVPDRAGYAAFLAAHLADTSGDVPALVVEPVTASAIVADGSRHDLGSRRALWRILMALVDHHAAAERGALDVPRLFAAGWPGERGVGDSAAGRVYGALSALRKLGLEPLIERFDGGWRLDPRVRVVVR